jgi:hypothetical protein
MKLPKKLPTWESIGKKLLEAEPDKTREPSPRYFFLDIYYLNQDGERVVCTTAPLTEKEAESMTYYMEQCTTAVAVFTRSCSHVMESFKLNGRKVRSVVFPSQQAQEQT